MFRILMMIMFSTLLVACHTPQQKIDRWMGRWNGPEGTYMVLAKQDDDTYQVNIQTSEILKTYQAKKVADHLEFMRNNKTEIISSGNGKDTGLQVFANKKKCLIIQKGEGFCRK